MKRATVPLRTVSLRTVFAAVGLATAAFLAPTMARAEDPPAAAPPAVAAPAPPAAAAPTTPPTIEEGLKIWNEKKNKCAQCHGADGKGDTKMGKSKNVANMATAEFQKKYTDQQMIEAIMKGFEREEGGKKVKMEPLKNATERDAQALVLVVRSFTPKDAAKDAAK